MATRPRACKKNISYLEVKDIFMDEKLYEMEIVERDQCNKRIKLHYVGYEKHFDEWRNETAEDSLL